MNSPSRDQLRRLWQAIRTAMLTEWNPIGVEGLPDDEFDAYVPAVCRMLLERKDTEEIFQYLWSVETEQLGLRGNLQTTRHFAERLPRLMNELEQRSS